LQSWRLSHGAVQQASQRLLQLEERHASPRGNAFNTKLN
jgi:hypothetical protein